VTAATWQWYTAMDAALQGQHSISLPLVVASNQWREKRRERGQQQPEQRHTCLCLKNLLINYKYFI